MNKMTLTMPEEFLELIPLRVGGSARILYSEALEEWLADIFNKPKLCLKSFPSLTKPEDLWEFVPLRETVAVQNIFAAEGWAPRVHLLAELNGCMVQVVDFCDVLNASPPEAEELESFWELVDAYGIGTRSRVDKGSIKLKWDFIHRASGPNWSQRRLLDWGGKYRLALYPEWDELQPARLREEQHLG